MKANRKYIKEMRKQIGYFATWLPGTPMAIGDIGVFKKNVFTKISNLSDKGIQFEIEPDTTESDIEHHSSGNVIITTKAAGKVIPDSTLSEINAGISVDFKRANSILFKANRTTTPSLKDQIKLGQQILALYKKGEWDKDWAVITELVHAQSSSILIATESESKIELEATGNITTGALDIADTNANFEVTYTKGVSTKIIAEKGLTPLFKASKVKSNIFRPPTFGIKSVKAMDLITPAEAMKNENLVYFGEADFDEMDEII